MKLALILSMVGLLINIIGAYIIWADSDGLFAAVKRLSKKINSTSERKDKSKEEPVGNDFNDLFERSTNTTKLGFCTLTIGFMLQFVSYIIQLNHVSMWPVVTVEGRSRRWFISFRNFSAGCKRTNCTRPSVSQLTARVQRKCHHALSRVRLHRIQVSPFLRPNAER